MWQEDSREGKLLDKTALSKIRAFEWDGTFKGDPVICILISFPHLSIGVCDRHEDGKVDVVYNAYSVSVDNTERFGGLSLVDNFNKAVKITAGAKNKPVAVIMNGNNFWLSESFFDLLASDNGIQFSEKIEIHIGRPAKDKKYSSARAEIINRTNEMLKDGTLRVPANMLNDKKFKGFAVGRVDSGQLKVSPRMASWRDEGVGSAVMWECISSICYQP